MRQSAWILFALLPACGSSDDGASRADPGPDASLVAPDGSLDGGAGSTRDARASGDAHRDSGPGSARDASLDGGRGGAPVDAGKGRRDGGGAEAGGAHDAGRDGNAADASSPTLGPIELAPVDGNPLGAWLRFDTSRPATVTVDVTEGDRSWTLAGPAVVHHELLILGMHADTDHTLTIRATAGGASVTQPLSYRSGALPADFPPIDVTVTDPVHAEPGVTLFNVDRWGPLPDPSWGYAIAVDVSGQPVWMARRSESVQDIRLLPNGNLLYNTGQINVPGGGAAVEMDFAGREVNRWTAASLGLDTIHHEIAPTKAGTFLTLSTELRVVSGYGDGGASRSIVGDLLAEFDRAGTVLRTWSAFDVFDPHVPTVGFGSPFFDSLYPSRAPTDDWTHGNAIFEDPTDGSLIASFRYLSLVVKLDRSTPAHVVWRAGKGGDFTLASGEWFSGQHAPELRAGGHLTVFDNGTFLATTPRRSRAVEYVLDTSAMTMTQVWEYRETPAFFSPFLGDADTLPGGNVLVTDGGRVADPALGLADPNNLKFGRIVEVTHESVPQKVLEFFVRAPLRPGFSGHTIYRAEHLSLLPGAASPPGP